MFKEYKREGESRQRDSEKAERSTIIIVGVSDGLVGKKSSSTKAQEQYVFLRTNKCTKVWMINKFCENEKRERGGRERRRKNVKSFQMKNTDNFKCNLWKKRPKSK